MALNKNNLNLVHESTVGCGSVGRAYLCSLASSDGAQSLGTGIIWRPFTCLLVDAAAAAKLLQSCPTLCDPIDGSPAGSPVPWILQARTLERVAISFSNAWKWKVKVKSLSHVRLLMTPMDCSLPGSSVHRIFQARVLEWDAIAFSDYTTICVCKCMHVCVCLYISKH